MVENERGASFEFFDRGRGRGRGRGRDTRTNVEQVVDVKPDTNMRGIVQIIIVVIIESKIIRIILNECKREYYK